MRSDASGSNPVLAEVAVSAAPAAAAGWRLEHSYAQLPAEFHAPAAPTPVRAPGLVVMNRPLAESLGLDPDALAGDDGAAWFAGNQLPPGALPLAQAYAGHQFGHFTTLGDGRAILLGEQITPGGERFDIQLKGPGPTPYARRGDGRAALGPMLREYIISEAMHALRIPTTRSLAVAATGELVWRQQGRLPGAVLTRVAASHIRVGTFQWAAIQEDHRALRALLDYTVRRHYPQLAESQNPAQTMLEAVIERQAALIAQWQLVGFIHGVMNTDNMALSGETIDYGPCAFMDAYDPATVFSSIDTYGRYAYGNQPRIAQWNLARLAESLLPLLHPEEEAAVALATKSLENFTARFEHHWVAGMRKKLGLFNEEPEDRALIDVLLTWMHGTKEDFTNTFAALADSPAGPAAGTDADFTRWHETWHARLARQPQSPDESLQLRRAHNPAFIPRNHLVEAALAAAEQGDVSVMHRLLDVLSRPFDHHRDEPDYRQPAPTGAACYKTFCGT